MHRSGMVLGGSILVLLLVVWELSVVAFDVPEYLLPAPSAIAQQLIARPGLYYQHSLETLWATLLGFAMAAALGVSLGIMISYSWILRGTLYPLVLLMQVVPKVAIAPILIIWVGYGMESKVVIAAIIAFFPIVINTVVGLASVEPELLDLVRVLGGTRLKEFVKISFPSAMPFIFSGFKISITFAVIGAIVAEFISGNEGLGYLIIVANTELNVAMAFAALLLLALIGILLFGLLAVAEMVLVPWRASSDTAGHYST